MLRFISSCTLLCSLFFVTVEEEVLSQTDDRAKAIDMFRKSVEQRERIKSGHWIITHRSDEIVPPPLQNSPVTLDIAFEGKKHRIHKKIGEREIILCLDCMPNTFAAVVVHPLMYNPPVPTRAPQVSDIPNPDGKTYPLAYLEFRDLDWNSEKNIIKGVSSIRDYGLPCREIGLIPHSCFGGFSFTTDLRRYYLVLSNRAETVTVSEEEFEGDKLVKIVWVVKTEFPNEVKSKMLEQMTTEFPDKVKALTEEQLVRFTKEQLVHRIQEEFWLAPNKDYIVRKAIHSSNGGFVYDLSNTVKYDHKSKFWYPNSWIFKSTTDREKTNVREEGTMELISINETFPKIFFDLSDIKQLERGTPVRWELSQPPLAKGQLYWSGKEVICKSDYRLSRETAKESRNWTLRRILTLCCVNAVFISLWTDWFFFRRYQKSLDK